MSANEMTVHSFQPINNRLSVLTLDLLGKRTALFGVYAPTAGSNRATVEEFYSSLGNAIKGCADSYLVLGDLNAQLGKEARVRFPKIVGKQSVLEETSGNYEHVLNFCQKFHLKFANSFFRHKPEHLWSWFHPKTGKGSQIDLILCSGSVLDSISDISVRHKPLKVAEHALVCADLFSRKRPAHPQGRAAPAPKKPRTLVVRDKPDFGTSSKSRKEVRDLIASKCAETLPGTADFATLETRLKAVQDLVPVKKPPPTPTAVAFELRKMPKRASSKQRQRLRDERAKIRRAALLEEQGAISATDFGTAEFFQAVQRFQNRLSDPLGRLPSTKSSVLKPKELSEWFASYFSLTSEKETISFLTLPKATQTRLGSIPREPEIRRACSKLKRNRSPGPDRIRSEIVLYGGQSLHQVVTKLLREL